MVYQNQQYEEVVGEHPVAPSRKPIAVVAVLMAVLAILGLYSSSHHSSPNAMENEIHLESLPTEGTTHVRACTFDECVAARCDPKIAPFICLFHNGGPHGGCSPTEWVEGTCTESCNLSGCDSMKLPDDVESCDGVSCGSEWCKIGQLCGSAAPYQCMEGAGRFGCADDPYHWVLNGCSCCDSTTCSD